MAFWFKRRRYGWGFTPSTWQGWGSLVAMGALVIVPAFLMTDDVSPGQVALYLVWVLVVVAAFIVLAVAKGPSPRWRWGRKPGDDPDEDF